MKKPVKIALLSLIPALVLAGGVVLALPDKKQPVELKSVSQSQSTEPSVEQAPVETVNTETTEQVAQTQPAPTPVAPAPTPEENKARIMAEVETYALAHGYDKLDQYGTLAQTGCIRQRIDLTVGFADYNAAKSVPEVQGYFAGKMYFQGPGYCGQVNI